MRPCGWRRTDSWWDGVKDRIGLTTGDYTVFVVFEPGIEAGAVDQRSEQRFTTVRIVDHRAGDNSVTFGRLDLISTSELARTAPRDRLTARTT